MSKRILIVEDDLLNRMFYEAVLAKAGHELMVVDDGARVMAAVRDFAPDCITMDINLPNVSGRNLIRQIRRDAALRHIPILAITAYAGKSDEQCIMRAGADGYLAKPLRIGTLERAIESLLATAPAAA